MTRRTTLTRIYREDDRKMAEIGRRLAMIEGKNIFKPEVARRALRVAEMPHNMKLLEEDARIKGQRKRG